MSGFNLGPIGPTAPPVPNETVRFLSRVVPLPGPGRFLNIHYLTTFGGKTGMPGTPFERVIDAANDIAYWQTRLTGENNGTPARDYYICMSLATVYETKVSKAGKSRRTAVRNSKSVAALKSFFMDLDVKKGGYASQADALRDLWKHVMSGAIPMPNMVVSSGNGIHVYWVLDQEVPQAVWLPIALRWGAYLTSLGLHHDSTCAVDSVRLLRIPGTFNCKDAANPKAVKIILDKQHDVPLSEITKHLQNITPIQPAQAPPGGATVHTLPAAFQGATPANAPPSTAPSNFSAGITKPNSILPDLAPVVAACPALSAIHARHGAGDSEPLWSQVIFASTFAANGQMWAHELSKGHTGYVQADTDAKFQHKDQSRQNQNLGWPSCQSFAQHCGECKTCPMLAFGKTPFHALRGVKNLDLPFGYTRRNGEIWLDTIDKNGDPTSIRVTTFDVRRAEIILRNNQIWLLSEIIRSNSASDDRQLILPLSEANNWQKAAKDRFADAGVTMSPETESHTRKFIMAFIEHLLQTSPMHAERHAFGWTDMRAAGLQGFGCGTTIHGPAGVVERAPIADAGISDIYESCGDLAGWKAAADVVLQQNRVQLDAIVAVAFGAPLARVTGEHGVLFNSWSSESGTQKSSAMRVAASVWGNPTMSMMKLDDTRNATVHTLGMVRHLPVFWDELHAQRQVEEFATLAFQLSLGVEKRRLTSDVTSRRSGAWKTILASATNTPLRGIMLAGSTALSSGGPARLLEQNVPVVALPTFAGDPGMVLGGLEQNFGLVGRRYAHFLADLGFDLVTSDYTTMLEDFKLVVGDAAEERFHRMAASAIMLGAEYANQLEGGTLFQFDLDRLFDHLCKLIEQARSKRADDSLDAHGALTAQGTQSLLHAYIRHARERNRCLETDIVPLGQGRFHGTVKLRMPSLDAESRLRSPVVHIVHDYALIRMLIEPFSEWVEKIRKLPLDVVVEALQRHASMGRRKLTWAPGTAYRDGQQFVWTFDFGPTSGSPQTADFAEFFRPDPYGGAPAPTIHAITI